MIRADGLRPLISQTLKAYRPIRTKTEEEKRQKSRKTYDFSLPSSLYLPDDFEPLLIEGKPVAKSAVLPFFLPASYPGRTNEVSFMTLLEANHKTIDWWFKNGDYGQKAFAVEYVDRVGKTRLFYPDFIIKQGNKIGLVDSKDGTTAHDESAGTRAKGLAEYIKNYSGEYQLWGGIAVKNGRSWMLNNGENYHFDPNDFSGWDDLVF